LGSEEAVVTHDLLLDFIQHAAGDVSAALCQSLVTHAQSWFVPCALRKKIRTERDGSNVVTDEGADDASVSDNEESSTV
jgi:hypothetical protein